MAVKRLIGKVDQIEIVFERMEGDLWQVQVPGDEDCTYILELYAADEAGNETFMTRIFFEYDRSSKKVIIKPVPYLAVMVAQQYFGEKILTSKEVGGCLKQNLISEKNGMCRLR